MTSVTVSPKYQVVIPKEVRESMGIFSGQKIQVLTYQNRIELIPVQPMKKDERFPEGDRYQCQEGQGQGMNVVDSSAWLSYFAGDKNAGTFARPIEAIDQLLVPSITVTEVFKSIMRQRDEDLALEAIAHMEQGRVVPLDSTLAINAAVYGVNHKLPLADSIIYATAKRFSAVIWTQDADFKALSDVKYYPKVKAS